MERKALLPKPSAHVKLTEHPRLSLDRRQVPPPLHVQVAQLGAYHTQADAIVHRQAFCDRAPRVDG